MFQGREGNVWIQYLPCARHYNLLCSFLPLVAGKMPVFSVFKQDELFNSSLMKPKNNKKNNNNLIQWKKVGQGHKFHHVFVSSVRQGQVSL